MTDVSESDIARLAPLFDHLAYDLTARPEYDMLSSALVWTDELPTDRSIREWGLIRLLLRQRTCVITGMPSEYRELWEFGKKYFPHWPGFRADRCTPSDELRQLYDKESARASREIDAWFPDTGE